MPVAVWSHYAGSGRKSAFVRVGTMDEPAACPPDVHIFTSTKQPWVVLPEGVPSFEAFYPTSQGIWSDEGRARWKALLAARIGAEAGLERNRASIVFPAVGGRFASRFEGMTRLGR